MRYSYTLNGEVCDASKEIETLEGGIMELDNLNATIKNTQKTADESRLESK
ncbi:hypothetical protein C1645_825941 [Glomus cerebriforme]|uniref:Uncharacterized protein n=1 Tax=Glomus cerebriforme TaxID=658196 RepID=A0A397SSL7_9GLOM|nr:hypothetical protein C1645_825941 [Glomus cerebriforme]